jgi:hypothetical protein
MLFDFGDADFELEALVDLVVFKLAEFGVEAIDVGFGCHLSAKIRDVVFGRHVLDDMGEHVGEFFEGCFLCCHTWEVYHVLKERTRTAPTLRGEAVERPYARPGRHTIIDRGS